MASPAIVASSRTEEALDPKDLRATIRNLEDLLGVVPADIDGVSQEQKWGRG